jgi:hypothetical protein
MAGNGKVDDEKCESEIGKSLKQKAKSLKLTGFRFLLFAFHFLL